VACFVLYTNVLVLGCLFPPQHPEKMLHSKQLAQVISGHHHLACQSFMVGDLHISKLFGDEVNP
jgi:hypothetical protein